MLTGNLPFKADTQMSTDSILKKITESDLEEIFIQLKNYPEVYQQIIRKCLVRDLKSHVQTAGELIEMLKISTNVIEEKTDDRVSSNHSHLEITEPLKPISKVIKENHFDLSREISEEELAKWNQPDAQHSLRVGSFHRGNVVSSTSKNDLTIRLEYGVCVKIEDYYERTHIPFDLGDYLESRITSCDFENHLIELGVLKKIEQNELSDSSEIYKSELKISHGVAIAVVIVLILLSAIWLSGVEKNSINEAITDSTAAVLAADTVLTINLPNGEYVIAGSNSFEDQIIKFISDDSRSVDKDNMIWFDTDKIKFKIDSPELYDDEESNQQFENIVKILEAFPKVYIKIGNCTENYSNPEEKLKLSTGRAKSAKNALVSRGIDSFRIEFAGYTSKSHIATALSVIRK